MSSFGFFVVDIIIKKLGLQPLLVIDNCAIFEE